MFGLIKKALGFYEKNYAPKLWEVIKNQGYSYKRFKRDVSAGLTVSVISIPLSMALAIASGVSPAQGLYTAIVAGFFIALLAGGRYQIGGPTGAFAIVILGVLNGYGYQGLFMTMLITGGALIIAGLLRLGTYIKYIPYETNTEKSRFSSGYISCHCLFFCCLPKAVHRERTLV